MAASVEGMRKATEEVNKRLGDAYPNGMAAEIEEIKRRLGAVERWIKYYVDRNGGADTPYDSTFNPERHKVLSDLNLW